MTPEEKKFQSKQWHETPEQDRNIVQIALDTYNDVYEAEYHLTGGATDNQATAMEAALHAIGAL